MVVAAAVVTGFVIRTKKGDDDVTGGSGDDQIFGGDGRDNYKVATVTTTWMRAWVSVMNCMVTPAMIPLSDHHKAQKQIPTLTMPYDSAISSMAAMVTIPFAASVALTLSRLVPVTTGSKPVMAATWFAAD